MFYLKICDDAANSCMFFCRTDKYTARKEYKCCECGKTIKKGEPYWYTVGRWDDDFAVFRMCLDCDKMWDKIIEVFERFGENPHIVFGMLRQAIEEAVEEGYLEELKERDPDESLVPLVEEMIKKWSAQAV